MKFSEWMKSIRKKTKGKSVQMDDKQLESYSQKTWQAGYDQAFADAKQIEASKSKESIFDNIFGKL